ncbi:hypothetical protein B0H13DRAFT_1863867 [Mycena leptocephala]|nr:hypothetical protein B0H13DRAFT_1863867 [Mycena leptocephala]
MNNSPPPPRALARAAGRVLGGPADFHLSFILPAPERVERRPGHPALDLFKYNTPQVFTDSAKEQQLKTSLPFQLRRDTRRCTRNFFERGIARSADSNPTRFMPPRPLYPKSPEQKTAM